MPPRRKRDTSTTVAVDSKQQNGVTKDDIVVANENPSKKSKSRSVKNKAEKVEEIQPPTIEETVEPKAKKTRGKKAQPQSNESNDNTENDKQIANNKVDPIDVSTKKRTRKIAEKDEVPETPQEQQIVQEKPKRGKKATPKATTSNSNDQQNDEIVDESNAKPKKKTRTKAQSVNEAETVNEPVPVKKSRKRKDDKAEENVVEEKKSKKTTKKIESTTPTKKLTKSRKGKNADTVEVATATVASPAKSQKKQIKSKSTPEKKSAKPNKRNVSKKQTSNEKDEEEEEEPTEQETKETDELTENADKKLAVEKPTKSRKRTAPDNAAPKPNDELITKRSKAGKDKKETKPKEKVNATSTNYASINFETDKEFTMKIVSWNVAGLRANVNKQGFEYFKHEKPDIICLQEIKCLEEEVPSEAKVPGYHPYWCSTPGGRGGVAILSKMMPYNIEKHIGDAEMDEEGRIITAEYSKFYLINVYVPNAGNELVNMGRRLRWNKMFEDHVNKLKAKKPVVIMGDMNVAHSEIDLANPKTNTKNAGFTPEERAGMTDLLSHGFVDTFRHLYPGKEKAYTFWSYRAGARSKNVGWRLDYAIVSENLVPKVADNIIRHEVMGSDHCPIVLLLNI